MKNPAGIQSFVKVDIAIERLGKVAKRFLTEAAMELQRRMSFNIPVDTGMARSHIRSEVDPSAFWARAGILYPFSANNVNVATYPAMMEMGIRRHFVSFYNPDRSLRWSFAAWAVRHGLGYWDSSRSRVLNVKTGRPMGGLQVWGYSVPWVSKAVRESEPAIKSILDRLEGTI